MTHQDVTVIEVFDEGSSFTLIDFAACVRIERDRLIEFVDSGLLEPTGRVIEQWRFDNRDLRRARAAQRLIADLGVNLAGVALILDLIEERDELSARVTMLERLLER